tara:strand:+ start:733 stop:1167 length:435 start_codon:yes stop_codon:yes gene_type:complete
MLFLSEERWEAILNFRGRNILTKSDVSLGGISRKIFKTGISQQFKMPQSQLVSALALGVDLQKLARTVRLVSGKGEVERENILARAERELPKDVSAQTQVLILDLYHDREFCRAAEVEYNNPQESGLIKVAVANYLLLAQRGGV